MVMYNLKEYSSSHSETTGKVWFYSKDDETNVNNDIDNNNKYKFFEYKIKILENTVAQPAPNSINLILKKWENCCAIKTFT